MPLGAIYSAGIIGWRIYTDISQRGGSLLHAPALMGACYGRGVARFGPIRAMSPY